MRPAGAPRPQGGFTIIESMIALFFLAFLAAEMGSIMIYASRSSNLSQRITRANALADEAIEKSRNTDYDNLQVASATLGEQCAMYGNASTCTSLHDGGRYTVERTVTPVDCDYTASPTSCTTVDLRTSGQADVVVTVSFTDSRGNPQAIRVASVVSRIF